MSQLFALRAKRLVWCHINKKLHSFNEPYYMQACYGVMLTTISA